MASSKATLKKVARKVAKKPAKAARRGLVTFLLDRTGSMQNGKQITIDSFNAYLKKMQEGDAAIDFTFLQFDSMSLDKICVAAPIKNVKPLTDASYQPRASTPLIDAAVKTIKAVEASLLARGDKPMVIICIQTDGEENCSTEHTWDELNALIKAKTKAGWSFSFMGASIDAYQQGARMGIATQNTMSYDSANPVTAEAAFCFTALNDVNAIRTGNMQMRAYSGLQKKMSGDKFDPNLSPKARQQAAQAFQGAAALQSPLTARLDLNPPAVPPKVGTVDDFTL